MSVYSVAATQILAYNVYDQTDNIYLIHLDQNQTNGTKNPSVYGLYVNSGTQNGLTTITFKKGHIYTFSSQIRSGNGTAVSSSIRCFIES